MFIGIEHTLEDLILFNCCWQC